MAVNATLAQQALTKALTKSEVQNKPLKNGSGFKDVLNQMQSATDFAEKIGVTNGNMNVSGNMQSLSASDVTFAMELGADGVLLNTGIAHAQDPVQMAHAMRHACIAGRLAYLSGRIPKKLYATASSPEEGTFTSRPK